MRFISICSGIDAASVAFNPLGWEAVAFSEIEPFPCAVLKHHYPNVPNFGDMTAFASWPEEIFASADAIVGGPPCQAFSVAGRRDGLADARGNLTLTYVDLINHADAIRLRNGKPPVVVLYENVPGIFSDKTNAFGCFLGALAGEVEELEPPGGKWTNAGCVSGPQRTIAWRILDAQYFGVAQRRKRVFVVASSREDFNPAEVLFEFDGVRRDTAPSRETRQTIAGGVEIGPGGGRFTDLNPTLDTRAKDGPIRNQLAGAVMQPYTLAIRGRGDSHNLEYRQDGAANALLTPNGGRAGIGVGAVAQPIITMAHGQVGAEVGFDRGPTLTCNHEAPIAAYQQPMPINTMVALRHEALGRGTGFGIGEAGDPAYTLTKGHSHAIAFHPTQDPITSEGGTTHAMGCGSSGGQASVAVAMFVAPAEVGPCMRSSGPPYSRTGNERVETEALAVATQPPMAVRRLTPVECERLQGFPDGYSMIPWRKKPASECPDGPRYKALGNSWAVPVVRWIGSRIQAHLHGRGLGL